MKIIETFIDGLLILEPLVFGDERGFFMESWNEDKFNEFVGESVRFVQDNHSKSQKGILRGLHFQSKNTQGKLVRVTHGSVFDVAVDLRNGSKTYGQWFGVILSGSNKKQMWIPKGFAHGFLALEDDTEFLYKCDDYYTPNHEHSLAWNDLDLAIEWPSINGAHNYVLSDKDKNGISFLEVSSFINMEV
ncbi:dTDP-4-dehydrorhamnose 3,5-epimerase [Vibrio vulnificus]|uniref:dTDP-4-dehydrorhamnose 3,5-epimerase n=1 Tax=Vibrio vulnificus TaxID=672 RepID=UPI00102A5C60|nr:dTDP-4-dehydrorhamnose 3,5-epimerase [Vibrio vulnificus]EGQ7993260.1 dTDP-4-dehydrorhamnose 3,5-epimerase [Vibrio vulnificus]EGQ9973427.1 dTDP-4-dehydrorhamnose 3,5-epimerase [Vibrio vulnificus]EHK9043999.1 dTDP-4-dehydrorhamnose 3,5-epimerase [Vibrio vulnificus]ELU2537058.1 dTDP-4-dehydrorhamnose 3,5-epimerase [Vibrio vulnificus]RZP79398.1 dTDP-4-dehydrorhamnose 3,5-epimerase [Vibrio vulnificus]